MLFTRGKAQIHRQYGEHIKPAGFLCVFPVFGRFWSILRLLLKFALGGREFAFTNQFGSVHKGHTDSQQLGYEAHFCSIGGSSAEVLQRSSDKNGWTSQKCQQKHLTRCTNSCLNIVDLTWHVQFRDVDACRDQLHIGSWRRCAHPVWCVRIRMWDLGGWSFFEGTFGDVPSWFFDVNVNMFNHDYEYE